MNMHQSEQGDSTLCPYYKHDAEIASSSARGGLLAMT
jgi:hypothetical protein